jgi:NAD dependent epimerase/dehydratase family enzyme
LSNEGGALKEFKKPLKFGVAGILSNGKQMISWIHIDDVVRMYIAAIENEKLQGTYNAVAPSPVSNKELTLELAKIIKGKFFVPVHVPSIVLKIMLGELCVEVLKSTTVSSSKIQVEGFTFLYSTIDAALIQLEK